MEITVNVTGLDNLANAIFALAKAAGNCKEETQVDATKVTPAVQQAVAPTATTTTVPSTPPARTNNTDCTSGARGTKYSTRS